MSNTVASLVTALARHWQGLDTAVSIQIHRPTECRALVRVEDKLRVKLTADLVTTSNR